MKFTKELLQAANALEIRSHRDVTALLYGQYTSTHRGSGMQFKDFRHYEPGDDVRHISWPLTARTGRTTLKIYEEERELNVLIAIDVSGSSLFGQGRKRKIDVYADLLAVTGLAAIRSGDKCGVLLFHDKLESYFPPKHSSDQIKVALTKLQSIPMRGKKSDLNPVLEFINGKFNRRSLVIIISDFQSVPFDTNCKQLGSKHELVLVHVSDKGEHLEGLEGVFQVQDPETGGYTLVDASHPGLKESVFKYYEKFEDHLLSLSKEARADYLPIRVQDDYLKKLLDFFNRRGRRNS